MMSMKPQTFLFGLLLGLSIASCQRAASPPPPPIGADTLIARAVRAHGMQVLDRAEVSFRFRNRLYRARREQGRFDYFRLFSDSAGRAVADHLWNGGFVRTIDGDTAMLEDKKAKAYGESVNSVIYFALLPYFLQDPAVKATYLGLDTVENSPYQLLEVGFAAEGGGSDHDDSFRYWFHPETSRLHYLAYTYHTDGGGTRFRKAVNPRQVNGVWLSDYRNYQPKTEGMPMQALARDTAQWDFLSDIVLEDMAIFPL
jgi:hypothetical protein